MFDQQLRTAIDNIPAIVWFTDESSNCVFVNDEWRTFTGRDPDDSSDCGWTPSIHADDRQDVSRKLHESMRQRQPYFNEYRAVRHDGAIRWMMERGLPRFDKDGRYIGYAGTITDITEHKRIEDALGDSQERLNAALEASGTGTFRWDIENDLMEWDDNLYRVYGLEPDRSIRSVHDFIALVHPDDRDVVRSGIKRIADEGLDFINEFRIVHPDGSIRWLLHRSGVYRNRDGRPKYMTGACMEITLRKRAELALRDAKDQSEQANLAKDKFLAMLSHELRTPLNPATLILDSVIGDPSIPSEINELLETARRNLVIQRRLIDDMLDLTRINSGKLRLERLDVHIHDVLETVKSICCNDLDEKQLRVTTEFEAADDRVTGDPGRLQQVFWNIIRNAAKFTPDGGLITVRTSSTRSAITVRVKDTGIGIEPEQLDRIFTPYAQAHDGGQGLGLGLAITRSIIEAHGGSIAAHSLGTGHGTTITLELPLAGAITDEDQPVTDSSRERLS